MNDNRHGMPKFFCPSCNSEDIEITNTEFYNEDYFVEFTKTCEDCKFQWNEVYEYYLTALDLCNICDTILENKVCPECGEKGE